MKVKGQTIKQVIYDEVSEMKEEEIIHPNHKKPIILKDEEERSCGNCLPVTISVRVNGELRRKIRTMAKTENKSMSGFIKRLTETEWLRFYQGKKVLEDE